MTFDRLRSTNLARVKLWHPGFPDSEPPESEWNIAEWTNALCGEAGEAANIAKKIRRIECGLHGRESESDAYLLSLALAEEIADVVIYSDLVLAKCGRDLWTAVRNKFNQTSIEHGFPQRL